MKVEQVCNDIGRPGCLEVIDPAQTMSFEDIGQGFIHFCAHCGPAAHALGKLLDHAITTRGEEFVKELLDQVVKAEKEVKDQQS